MNLLAALSSPALRQFLLLLLVIAVPAVCLILDRDDWLAFWIVLTCCVDVFHLHILINLPAAPFAGLCLLVRMGRWLPGTLRTTGGKALVVSYLYLALLGVVFGFLLPWPAGTVFRLFNQTAPGRSVLYLIHLAGNISLAIFMADYLRSRARLEQLLRWLWLGTSLTALAAVIQRITGINWYALVTGLPATGGGVRVQGLNFEPRGLGLIAGYGLVVCIILLGRRRHWLLLGGLIVDGAALFLTLSTSAILGLAFACLVLLLLDRRSRWPLLVTALSGLCVVTFVLAVQPQWSQEWLSHVEQRVGIASAEVNANNWVESLALRTEVFDGSALMFFEHHPVYLLWGTGPGLISLPATQYVPARPEYEAVWTTAEGQGVNSPPTIGLLLLLADGGCVGLTLWCLVILAGWRALGRAGSADPAWLAGRAVFLASAAFYLVQASPVTPVAYLLLGLGLAGERRALAQAWPTPRLTAAAGAGS